LRRQFESPMRGSMMMMTKQRLLLFSKQMTVAVLGVVAVVAVVVFLGEAWCSDLPSKDTLLSSYYSDERQQQLRLVHQLNNGRSVPSVFRAVPISPPRSVEAKCKAYRTNSNSNTLSIFFV
jgi:hypothetical protein